MSTPALATPAAARAAAMSEIAALADQLRLLSQEAHYAASAGDDDDLAVIAERILPLQARFAGAYRSWLARRPGRALAAQSPGKD